MKAVLRFTCGCSSEGPRCGHPIPQRNGPEVFATIGGREIRIARCQLWPQHGQTGVAHNVEMQPQWGSVVTIGPLVRGEPATGTCRRCGEEYTVVLTASGLMTIPDAPERMTDADILERVVDAAQP